MKNHIRSTAPALLLALASLISCPSRADQADFTITPQKPATRGPDCGPNDPHCSDRLQNILSSVHIGSVQAEGGVTFGGPGANGAVKFSAQVLSTEYTSGDLKVLLFDAMYLPGNGGFRVRFTLGDTEVLFMCNDMQGKTVAPLATLFSDCVPGGAYSYVGAGAKLTEIQWDIATHRVAARWAEIHAVLNLLGNANSESYLKKQLRAYMGASLDTYWYGETPGTDGGSKTVPRANFGISGMVRSDDNHWELRGMAGIRPSMISPLSDFSIEARTQALYHLLLSNSAMLDLGVDAQYQFNKIPANSMGDFVSDRDRNSAYIGGVFGFTFQ